MNSSYAQNIDIYEVSAFEISNGKQIGFASLSENYQISFQPDSLVISDFSETEMEDHKYFLLEKEYRNTFLQNLKIAETDSVFIFDYVSCQITSAQVNSLKVVAILNEVAFGYSDQPYMIGFELDISPFKHLEIQYGPPFVYVGKENPFVKNSIKPIIWKKKNPDKLTTNKIKPITDSLIVACGVSNYVLGDYYIFKGYGFLYYSQEITRPKTNLLGRSFIIEDSLTHKIVYSKAEFHSEGTYIPDITIDSLKEGEYGYQFTGMLFENKPPVVFGLFHDLYWCSSIKFLSLKEKPIIIKCDNRN